MKAKRAWPLRLDDIIYCAERIRYYTQDETFESFCQNELLCNAVLRWLIVIGEATYKIPKSVRAAHKSLPWDKVSAMRHIIIHEYSFIDFPIVWHSVQHDLPDFIQQIQTIRNEST